MWNLYANRLSNAYFFIVNICVDRLTNTIFLIIDNIMWNSLLICVFERYVE